MKTIHIINPAAGQGKAKDYLSLENVYVTKAPGDATEFIKKTLGETTEDINFCIYGGDGTVNEAACSIVSSGSEHGYLSIVPVGTGNDLVRSLPSEDVFKIDVLTMNERFAVNAINTGFDLEVVQKATEFKKKPLISGPLAYVLGVVSVLCQKLGKNIKITYEDESGNIGCFEGECLLAVAANGAYYGGGFKASPAAKLSDGLIDLMIVKKVSRLKFLSLVAGYKKGLHIDEKTGDVNKKFSDVIIYRRCKSVKFENIKEICADGEIFTQDSAQISVIPGALKIIVNDKETANV